MSNSTSDLEQLLGVAEVFKTLVENESLPLLRQRYIAKETKCVNAIAMELVATDLRNKLQGEHGTHHEQQQLMVADYVRINTRRWLDEGLKTPTPNPFKRSRFSIDASKRMLPLALPVVC